jgi:hypothetical protein
MMQSRDVFYIGRTTTTDHQQSGAAFHFADYAVEDDLSVAGILDI